MSEELQDIQIYVAGCGWEVKLSVTRATEVYEVKMMIMELKRLPFSEQILSDGNTACLDDCKTLGFYDMKEESKIWVINPSSLLSIKMPQLGLTFLHRAYVFNTIEDIKYIICEKTGMPLISQNLVYEGNLLEGRMTIKNCGMRSTGSVVFAIFGLHASAMEKKFISPMAVQRNNELLSLMVVQPNKELLKIQVKPWYTFLDVKTVIESTSGIPVCVQQLSFNQKQLEDWKYVSDYAMRSWTIIHMRIIGTLMEVSVFLSFDGTKHRLTVNSSDTVDSVMKRMIEKTEISCWGTQACLFLDENRLMGDKMLALYDIKEGDALHLRCPHVMNVIKPDGTTTRVEVFSYEGHEKKVEEICGIPYELLEVC